MSLLSFSRSGATSVRRNIGGVPRCCHSWLGRYQADSAPAGQGPTPHHQVQSCPSSQVHQYHKAQMIQRRRWRSTTTNNSVPKSTTARSAQSQDGARMLDVTAENEATTARFLPARDLTPASSVGHAGSVRSGDNALSDCAPLEHMLKSELLRLCDSIIQQSRRTSDESGFIEVQEMLQHATELYLKLVQRSKASSDTAAGLAYETYLMRSTHAHAVRAIGALSGAQGAKACARMMLTYLHCEVQLRSANFDTNDGLRQQVDNFVGEGEDKDKQMNRRWNVFLLMSGPFLHDMSLVLYDLFIDLAGKATITRRRAQKGQMMPPQRRTSAGPDRETLLLLRQLWISIRRFPSRVWTPPFSPEWMRTRNHIDVNTSTSGAQVIIACSLVYVKTLVSKYRFDDAIAVWLAEVQFWDTNRPHLARMLKHISDALRQTRRDLMACNFNNDVDHRSIAAAYCLGLLRLAQAMRGDGDNDKHISATRTAAWSTMRLETIIRCILRASEMIELDVIRDAQDQLHLIQANDALRTWLEDSLDVRDDRYCWPKKMLIRSCNLILDRCTSERNLFGQPSFLLGFRFLRAMEATHTSLPAPNDDSITTLMINAVRLREQEAIRACIKAAYGVEWLRLQRERELDPTAFDHACDADGAPFAVAHHLPINVKVVLVLLQEAKQRMDAARLIALLKALRASGVHRAKATLANTEKRPRTIAPFNAAQIVFLLYPSLDLRRRARRERLHRLVQRLRAQNLTYNDEQRTHTVHEQDEMALRASSDRTLKGRSKRPLIELHPATCIKDLTAKSVMRKPIDESDGWPADLARKANKLLSLKAAQALRRQRLRKDAILWKLRAKQRLMQVQYDAPVLLSVLALVVQQGKTGLAERLWRLMLRTYTRRNALRGDLLLLPHPQPDEIKVELSVRALELMMFAYSLEVRRGMMHRTPLRGRSPLKPNSIVGWGLVKSGPSYDKTVSGEMMFDRVLMAREMAIERYTEVRKIWQSKGILRNVMTTATAAEAEAEVGVLRQNRLLPDQRLYRAVVCVFRRRGGEGQELDVNRHTHAAFLQMLVRDMHALGIDIPADVQEYAAAC